VASLRGSGALILTLPEETAAQVRRRCAHAPPRCHRGRLYRRTSARIWRPVTALRRCARACARAARAPQLGGLLRGAAAFFASPDEQKRRHAARSADARSHGFREPTADKQLLGAAPRRGVAPPHARR
jgi:hypothetical protein